MQIGSFFRTPNGYEGIIETATLDIRISIVPAEASDAEKAPDWRVHRGDGGEGGTTQVVGIALWYLTFSTWQVRNGIWLEDLYVEEDHRGSGLGVALLRTLADTCVQRGYGRLEWCVLRWNEPSIRFYESVGARPQSEWETYRLTGDALSSFAGAATA